MGAPRLRCGGDSKAELGGRGPREKIGITPETWDKCDIFSPQRRHHETLYERLMHEMYLFSRELSVGLLKLSYQRLEPSTCAQSQFQIGQRHTDVAETENRRDPVCV